jgi:hypothetical protein
MKPISLVLAVSLIGNAALVAWIATKSSETSTATSSAKPPFHSPAVNPSAVAGGEGDRAEVEKAVKSLGSRLWESLNAGDARSLADRLRAGGFPPEVVRAVVVAQIAEQFTARKKALAAKAEETPYWARRGFGMTGSDVKLMSEMRQLNREQSAMVREILGPDAISLPPDMEVYMRRQYGALSPEKYEQVQTIFSDYSDMRSEIYAKTNGVMLPEDRQKLALLEKEQRADLAGVLSPQELEAYELRSSTTASTLRSQLTTFKPTEEEFLALFRATRAAEEKYGAVGNMVGGNTMMQVRDYVLQQVQGQLNPARYAELQQASDPAYSAVNRLVDRLELPASAATQVVAVQRDVQGRAAAIRGNRDMPAEQKAEQLAALSQEATTKLTATLGANGLEAYKQYGGGWIQGLAPRPPTSAAAK